MTRKTLKTSLKWVPICFLAGIFLLGGTVATQAEAQESDPCTDLQTGSQSFIPLAPPECWDNIQGPDTNLASKDILRSLLYGMYENIRYVFSALAVAFLVYNGFRFVTADNDEETIKKQKTHLLWSFIGISLMAGAWEISQIFEYTDKTFLADSTEIKKRIDVFDDEIRIILAFGRYLIGSITVLFLVLSGAKLVTSGYDEQTVSKAKHNFAASMVGLIIIMIADYLINQVLYKVSKTGTAVSGVAVEPAVNVGKGIELLGQITNFVASFAGPVGVLMLIIAAVLYLTAAGEEQKMTAAKGIVKATIIGLIVIYGAYALVVTFISGSVSG